MKIDTSSTLAAYQASKTPNISKNNSDEKLREQTDAFEAILLKFMLDTSLNLESPLYPKQPGSEIYQGMYKDTLAQHLSGGFGYSQALFDWLKEQQRG
ncbi:Rod binding protein [Helicobacter canis]|uniref:Rod binding protein n=1 Tax=Helicobacter canis TaxID=29419 RepID=A0A5M9QFU7_9HELI|nr:Rod binding protein [Helicobacter canis]KAA8707378.1 Rod binding protein [Helicobacter canis]